MFWFNRVNRRDALKQLVVPVLGLCGIKMRKDKSDYCTGSEKGIPKEDKIPIYCFPDGRRVPKEECRHIRETWKMIRKLGGNAYIPIVDGQIVHLERFLINIDTGEVDTDYWS